MILSDLFLKDRLYHFRVQIRLQNMDSVFRICLSDVERMENQFTSN